MRPPIPPEYEEYIAKHGLGELDCWIPSQDSCLAIVFWSMAEIVESNDGMQIDTFAPGYVAFAGDGGDELYVFDESGAVFLMPMIGMDADSAEPIAGSFTELKTHFREISA
ncbi:hypothetical protein CAL29_23245 [Bordetella genomosp. 10]|uniref:Knr4/Smi1-like domain-containing protein n=1 Tax=Bordetella genomosp. 10 TaxID=1416804 RepID=A0A261S0K5_9BORD|nr:SMI1/KNR4 family protein [Bordetella genomosp. 10]OZI30886.1 hypothetical protein CAL29_23245 [Bordetella genomosp. 10]